LLILIIFVLLFFVISSQGILPNVSPEELFLKEGKGGGGRWRGGREGEGRGGREGGGGEGGGGYWPISLDKGLIFKFFLQQG
jgi:uncharacterized membrane protein YgcG